MTITFYPKIKSNSDLIKLPSLESCVIVQVHGHSFDVFEQMVHLIIHFETKSSLPLGKKFLGAGLFNSSNIPMGKLKDQLHD